MQESVVIFMRFYAPNNFSGCTTGKDLVMYKCGFYTPNNFSRCTTLGRSMTSNQGFIPLTILVGVQPQILLGTSCAIFLTE